MIRRGTISLVIRWMLPERLSEETTDKKHYIMEFGVILAATERRGHTTRKMNSTGKREASKKFERKQE